MSTKKDRFIFQDWENIVGGARDPTPDCTSPTTAASNFEC
jgi:hypothetical protein